MKRFLILLAALMAFAAAPARAALQVDVTQGVAQPLPIAIPDFVGDPQAGANIAGVVRADLERSGLFRPLDQKGFAERITNINTVPDFGSWRSINAQGLVTGQVTQQPDGRLRVEFRLWDVYGGVQMVGMQFHTTPDTWRRVAHMVSDAIYERITGEKGYFDTRIVFIAESGPAQKRIKRLAIMDQDGANPNFPHQRQLYGADPALQSDGADDRLHVLYFRQAARSICSISRRASRRCWATSPT